MRIGILMAAAIWLSGCGKRQAEDPSPPAPAPAPAVPSAIQSALAVVMDARAITVAPPRLNAAWFGEAPRLPAELKNVDPTGHSIDSIVQQGIVVDRCPSGFGQCIESTVPGVLIALYEGGQKPVVFRWELLTTIDVRPILQQAWGTPDACGRWVNRGHWLVAAFGESWALDKTYASCITYKTAASWLVVAGILQSNANSVALGKPAQNAASYLAAEPEDELSRLLGARISVTTAGGLIQSLVAVLGCPDERAAITATLVPVLGEPAPEAGVTVWRNEARGLLVTLDDKDLKVAPYKSVSTTLQAAKGTWSFESKRLLGTPWPELLAAYQAQAEAGPGIWQLELNEEVDDAHHVVTNRGGRITVAGQEDLTLAFAIDRRSRVKGYVFMLPYGASAEVKRQLLALIENRYGKGTPRPDDVEVIDLSTSPKVWLRDHLNEQRFEIVVGAITDREYLEMQVTQGL